MPTTVYTLELKHHRYFVGQTRHLERRYASHEAGEEGRWTARYKPRRIIRAKRMSTTHADFHVNYYVARLMLKHGIQYVRGGKMQTADKFTCDDREDVVDFLTEYLEATPEAVEDVVEDQILACGRRKCRFCGKEELSESEDSLDDDDTSIASSDEEEMFHDRCEGRFGGRFRRGCRRCGMEDHNENVCDEVRDVDGTWLRGCTRCGRMHRESECYSTRDACGRRLR